MTTMRIDLDAGELDVECPCGAVTALPALWCRACGEELDQEQAANVEAGTA